MKYLRLILLIYATVCIVGGIYFLRQPGGGSIVFAGYLLINAMVVAVGVLFEIKRYTSKSKTTEAWQPTNEKFIDPTTGKLMEVHYNSKTGERSYREVHRN